MRFFRSPSRPILPAFHPDTVIRDWGNGDCFRISDAVTGVLCTGGTGSGKTTGVSKHVFFGYAAAGFGMLILTAKADECEQIRSWAAQCGRDDDLVIINANGDWRFNFLDWQAEQKGGGNFTINVVHCLDEIAGAISNTEKSGGDEKFWEQALHNLNSNLVDLPVLAGLPVSLPLLRDIASSAPQTPEQVNDPQWQQKSACFKLLQEADEATKNADPETRADFKEVETYWLKDFASLSDRTRSSIMLGFSVLIRPLVTRPLRKIFSSDTNITPEAAFEGKIIVVDIPVQTYQLAGRISNLIFKLCMQSAILRRVQPADRSSFLRPVAIWADEAQLFATRGDAVYQATARSAAGATVYLTQSRESLRYALKNDDAVESLLANLQAKFFCQSSSHATNEWAANLLGQRYVQITSTNAGFSHQLRAMLQPFQQPNQNASVSRAQDKRFYVEPSRFTTLKRGGPQNNFHVEAVTYLGGHLFESPTGERLPYRILLFNQK